MKKGPRNEIMATIQKGNQIMKKQIYELLSRKQIAKILGVNERTVDNYRKRGMPHIKLPSGSIRFNEKEVFEWLKEETK